MHTPATLIRHLFHMRPHEPVLPFLATGLIGAAGVLSAFWLAFVVLAGWPL